MLKILAHAPVVIGLYLAFSFALFLGLQVNPLYGNMGVVLACAVLAHSTFTSASSEDSPGRAQSPPR